jgi:hypothetical protein
MTSSFEHIDMPDRQNFLQWLNHQPWLTQDISPEQVLALILFRLYQLEKKIDLIKENTTTHWAG